MISYLQSLHDPWLALMVEGGIGTWNILALFVLGVVGIVGVALLAGYLRSRSSGEVRSAAVKVLVVILIATASIVVVSPFLVLRQGFEESATEAPSERAGFRAISAGDSVSEGGESVSEGVVAHREGRDHAVTSATYKAVRSRDLFGESDIIPSGEGYGCNGDREVIYRLRDPLEEWKRQSALPDDKPRPEPAAPVAAAAKAPGPPAWVADAGGSSPFSLRLNCVSIIGRRPGPAGDLVGYSGAWQPDAEQARADADRSATEQLSAILLRNLAIRAAEAPDLSPETLLIDDLLDLVEARARVASDELHVDRFVDERTRNYGSPYTLYREAKRIRVPEERLAEITDTLVADLQRAHARLDDARVQTLWTLAAAAGLALVAFLLYSFINAGTKGYFAWPLRIVSLSALVLLYLGLFYFRGWLD